MPKAALPPTRSDILQKAADGTLFDALFDEYGRHWFGPDDPTIELLARLHNEGEIDLLALVTPEALESRNPSNFLRGQHLYQSLIAKLDASAEALMHVVEALRMAAGHDVAANFPIDEFAKWCGADSRRPAELLALIDAGVPNADHYLIIAIKNGATVDPAYFIERAYQFLNEGSEAQRLGAISALGQIALANDADWDRLISAFTAMLTPGPGDLERSALLQAIVRRLKEASPTRKPALLTLGLAAVAPLGQHTLYEAARTLAFSFEHLPAPLVDALVEALLAVEAGHQGIIDLLDIALTKLVEVGEVGKARSFLEIVLTRQEGALSFQQFDSLSHKLVEAGGLILEDWVVAWLRLGHFRLCNEMDKAMFGSGDREVALTIDFTRFGLADVEVGYLARKTIATFFLKPVLMTSILTSLLRSAAKEVATEIEALLIDPVLINYSGVAADALQPVAADSDDLAGPAAARALTGLQAYIDGLKSIGTVKELRPSERERQLEWERHSDAMNEAMSAARKKSIFAQIMTEKVMLYGNRVVSWIDLPTEPPRRMENQLATIGTSFEMPRVETVDPLGLQLMLLQFRAETPPA